MGLLEGNRTFRCTDPAVYWQWVTLSADGGEVPKSVPGPCAFRVSMLLHIWSSDTAPLRWLLGDQSGSTDPTLRNARRITRYFLTQLSAFSANFSRADMHCSIYTRTSFGYLSQIRKGSSVDVSQSRGYIFMTAGTIRRSSSQDSFRYGSVCIPDIMHIPFTASITVSFSHCAFKLLYSNEFIFP